MSNQSAPSQLIAQIEPATTIKNSPKIYSKTAVWGFSIAFTPIVGGLLLRQNLIEAGKTKAANIVLIFSVALTLLTAMIMNNAGDAPGLLTFVINMIWGGVLSQYLFTKYIPSQHRYSIKTVWKPLIWCVAISFSFFLLQVYVTYFQ